MKNVLLLSYITPNELEEDLNDPLKNRVIQHAANQFQSKLISGFDSNYDVNLWLLNTPLLGSFPLHSRIPYVDSFSFSHNKDADKDYNIGFLNFPFLRVLISFFKTKKKIKENIDEQDIDYIIAYSMTLKNVVLLSCVKKWNVRIKTVLIVPDLPLYMNNTDSRTSIYLLLKKTENLLIRKRIKNIDGFVIFSKYMRSFLNNKECLEVEGIVDDAVLTSKMCEKRKKTILYSGAINKKYGIDLLMDAFTLIKDDSYELVICGDGDAKESILHNVKKDKRIKYLGVVNHSALIKLQREATVLVNPRPSNGEFTKYSFPSKIMEYLSSGTPVIAFKLDGIPDDYDDYIIYPEDETAKSLSKTIENVCNFSQEKQQEIGRKAQEFVLKNKNKFFQSKRILDFMEDLKV